jgi:hypothetical protein
LPDRFRDLFISSPAAMPATKNKDAYDPAILNDASPEALEL